MLFFDLRQKVSGILSSVINDEIYVDFYMFKLHRRSSFDILELRVQFYRALVVLSIMEGQKFTLYIKIKILDTVQCFEYNFKYKKLHCERVRRVACYIHTQFLDAVLFNLRLLQVKIISERD